MANNKLEMVGQFISGTTDYPVTIPDFVPNMTIVMYIKVTAVTDTYSQTTAVLASSADYSFILQGDGTYNIQFASSITSEYVAFVIRQPYTKPVSSWNDLTSNAGINYIALNEENEQIYEDFYTQFDFQTDRVMVLETAYKWEEMKVFPYLDEEFLFLKRGGKIIGIHRTELIKEQMDEILGILDIMRDIQTGVTTIYNHIQSMQSNIQTMYNQISTWYVNTQNFYNQCLILKNQCQDLYDLMVTTGDNYITQITTLSANAVANINSTLNNALSLLNSAKENSLDDIEAAKIQAIKDIEDAASEIIGGDFLIKGGTTYTSAKAMEDDIRELQTREGGDIIRVKFSIGLYDAGGGSMQRYLKVSDLDGVEINTFDKLKKYNGVIDTEETTGNIYGQVQLFDGTTVLPIYRPGTYNGNFTQTNVNFTDFKQYSLQELYWENELNAFSGGWALHNSYLPFTSVAPGLFDMATYGTQKYDKGFVNMNMGAYTDEQIITNLNTAFLSGKNAQVNMFMYGSGITPTLNCDTNGMIEFETISTTMILRFYPSSISGYSILKAETRVPMIFDSTKGKYVMNTGYMLRNLGNWRFYGFKQDMFSGSISRVLSSGTTTAIVNSTDLGINLPIMAVKAINLIGSISTSRTNGGSGTFPFNQRIFTGSYTTEFPLVTYRTSNGSYEQITVAVNSSVNINTQVQLTFLLRARTGTIDPTGTASISLQKVEFEYF